MALVSYRLFKTDLNILSFITAECVFDKRAKKCELHNERVDIITSLRKRGRRRIGGPSMFSVVHQTTRSDNGYLPEKESISETS
jgi:hypothetical protein